MIRAIKGSGGVRSLVLEIAYRSDEFITITGDSGEEDALSERRQSAALRTYSYGYYRFHIFLPGRMFT